MVYGVWCMVYCILYIVYCIWYVLVYERERTEWFPPPPESPERFKNLHVQSTHI
ncbi:hypothetical protein T484DRAFT_1925566 [Baffinella frigidus]|nr:hypothetical protein T484DRAFT_1925566 [Cryptophyta sp. CCMP2293]